MSVLQNVLLGAVAALSLVASAFFLRFWRSSRERLFLDFAAGFGALSVDWIALALTSGNAEARAYVFVLRLVAFLLIGAGIVDKNRER